MKEGGEVWLCDLSSFTARCFILKPLIYCFSPSAAVQVIRTGGGVWRGTDRAKDCQPNCLTASEPPIMGASQSRVVTRAAGGSAGVSSQLLHRFADLTLRILRNSTSSSWSNEPGEQREGKKNAVRVEPATPESSQLLHCCTATVCSSEESATLFDTIREADDSGGRLQQLSLLFFLFSFFKTILANNLLHIPGRNSPICCKTQLNPIYAKPLFLFLLFKILKQGEQNDLLANENNTE